MFAPCGMNCKVCYKHCYHKKPCAGCLNSDQGKPEHCLCPCSMVEYSTRTTVLQGGLTSHFYRMGDYPKVCVNLQTDVR